MDDWRFFLEIMTKYLKKFEMVALLNKFQLINRNHLDLTSSW